MWTWQTFCQAGIDDSSLELQTKLDKEYGRLSSLTVPFDEMEYCMVGGSSAVRASESVQRTWTRAQFLVDGNIPLGDDKWPLRACKHH